MSKGGTIAAVIIFLIIGGFIFYYINSLPPEPTDTTNDQTVGIPSRSFVDNLTIASWNLQIFGQDKASDGVLMAKYANVIGKYDVVFVQEIRDISETSFNKLCNLLPEYSCLISSRAGRSTSKEQIGLIYKKGVIVLGFTDYNSDSSYQQYFERPPVKIIVQIAGTYEGQTILKNLTIWNIHTKPEDVSNEMTYLEQIVYKDSDTNQPIIVSGDLNFDCSYADHTKFKPFPTWFWAIGDDADTTVGDSNCAYDRFITNFGWSEYGIDTTITEDMSDHYLAWVKT